MILELHQIILSYACFGILVQNDIVITAPPIARWMEGKHLDTIDLWVKAKHGSINLIKVN